MDEKESKGSAPCCCAGTERRAAFCFGPVQHATPPWVTGTVDTAAGQTPRVRTALVFADRVGSWKARWGVGRMHYAVEPGLYAVGQPSPESPVFVSANYKMSFDRLRSNLAGRDGWILVLDTKGINVWCAAGKGTFGTDELVARAAATRLAEVVSHRQIVVPQLGAPGVSAHQVRERSGFKVVYGPVRAEDLPAFLDAGMRATPDMRRVTFPFRERLALIPMELVMSAWYAVFILLGFYLVSGFRGGEYAVERAVTVGTHCAVLFVAAYVAGAAATPALLPWLPGRAFSTKGAAAGLAAALGCAAYAWKHPAFFENGLAEAGWLVMIPALASFLAMNFTGASTYTSLSGVHREMRWALPLQVVGSLAGLGLWVAGRLV